MNTNILTISDNSKRIDTLYNDTKKVDEDLDLKDLVSKYPNDQELGRYLRMIMRQK